MSKKLLGNILKYGITAVLGGLLAWFVAENYGFAEATDTAAQIKALADAFTIPGVIIIMLGCLVMVANGGFFNGISYAMGVAVRMLIPGGRTGREETYGEFVERRSGKEKVSFAFLFIVGGVYLAAAVVCIILYYNL